MTTELLQAWDSDASIRDSGGNHHCTGPNLTYVSDLCQEPAVLGRKPFHFSGDNEAGAENPGLLIPPLHQVSSAEPSRKTEVIPDQGTGPGLAPDCLPFHDDGTDSFRRGVDGRAEPGWSCSDDQQIEVAVHVSQGGRNAPGFEDVGVTGIDQSSAADGGHPYRHLAL